MDNRSTTGFDPFSDRLLRGEKVIWRGRPQSGLMVSRSGILMIPFSLLWGGFAIFWEAMLLQTPHPPMFMVMFGAVFVLAGLLLIFGRFFLDALIRAGLSYALTGARLSIATLRQFASR